MNSIAIQNGPIKENGVNGCQIDALIETALLMLSRLNEKFPCLENKNAMSCLGSALRFLDKRRIEREKRGVKGESKK